MNTQTISDTKVDIHTQLLGNYALQAVEQVLGFEFSDAEVSYHNRDGQKVFTITSKLNESTNTAVLILYEKKRLQFQVSGSLIRKNHVKIGFTL